MCVTNNKGWKGKIVFINRYGYAIIKWDRHIGVQMLARHEYKK